MDSLMQDCRRQALRSKATSRILHHINIYTDRSSKLPAAVSSTLPARNLDFLVRKILTLRRQGKVLSRVIEGVFQVKTFLNREGLTRLGEFKGQKSQGIQLIGGAGIRVKILTAR
jgi:hypothetical protein